MERASTTVYLWLISIPLLILGLWAEWQSFFYLWYHSIIYSHGFLVLGGILFLLYQRRRALMRLKVCGSIPGLFLLSGAIAALVLSQAADIRVFRLALVPPIIVFWGWSIWGKGFASVAGGPVFLLMFAVPVWDDFSPILQHITVFFNTLLLKVVNIPATIHEFYITLEVGTFLVENGCSGVRYLMVALFLAAFYGQLYFRSNLKTLTLILTAGALSMVANWIRVFGIIVSGHYTNMESSLIEDHELFGWAIFVGITLVPLFFISARLEQTRNAKNANSATATMTGNQAPTKATTLRWPAIASLLLLAPPLLPAALDARTERMAHSWDPQLPDANLEWSGPLKHASIWQPDYVDPDIEHSGVYVSEDLEQVQVQITAYQRQAQEKELIFYRNQLFKHKDWTLVSRASRSLELPKGIAPATINETVIQKNGQDSAVILWSWYQVGDQLTHSRIEAKARGALNKLKGDARGALWAMAGRCEGAGSPECERQRSVFIRFLNSLNNSYEAATNLRS